MAKQPFLRPEYKRTFFLEWELFEDAQGCSPVERDGLCLQMDKAPPALARAASSDGRAVSAPLPSPRRPPPAPKKDSARAFLEWMIERREKKDAQAQARAQGRKPQPKLPPPFDLYDIPGAMKAAGFPVSAKLAQKWLDGAAHTAHGSDEPGKAKEGRYPNHLLDLSTVSLSWLRGYSKIEQRYQALLGKLDSAPALNVLGKTFAGYLASYPGLSHDLNTREHSQGDWQTLHERFQFQFEPVSMLDTLLDSLGMTDVTASLANFNFYAAVARAHINTSVYNRYNTPTGTQLCFKSTVKITHVWVYAKDSYSFHDSGESSQYLGHWNKHGVIVLPLALAASIGMKRLADAATRGVYAFEMQEALLKWANAQRIELWNDDVARLPVDIGKTLVERDVYYPVRNRDYRDWREAKERGGDFLIMTQPKLVKLDRSIEVDMAEVCK